MKRLLSVLLTTVLFASPAFAIVGGPWDANIPGNPNKVNPANVNGTYQGTIKGSNITGVMTFQTSGNGIAVTGTSGATQIQGAGIMASQTSQVYSYTSGTNAAALSYGTSSVSQIQGAAILFTEGATAFSEMSVAVDLGSRKLAGVMSGGSLSANTISVMAPANSIYLYWQLTNNFSFNGAFNASLSKNWSDNSFTGKGSLVITKFDSALYNQAAVGTSANVNPSNYVSSIPTPIKVRGVKTSDSTAPLWTTFNSTASLPTAVPIAR